MNKAAKYLKPKQTQLDGEIYEPTIAAGNFTAFSQYTIVQQEKKKSEGSIQFEQYD